MVGKPRWLTVLENFDEQVAIDLSQPAETVKVWPAASGRRTADHSSSVTAPVTTESEWALTSIAWPEAAPEVNVNRPRVNQSLA